MRSFSEQGQSGPGRWLGVGLRLLATIFFLLLLLALSRCGSSTQPPAPPPTEISATTTLRVEVTPHGAGVFVDGEYLGITPLVVEGPPGQHTVRVELEGYEPLEQTITLAAGDEATVSGELVSQSTALPGPTVPTATLPPEASTGLPPDTATPAPSDASPPTSPPTEPPPTVPPTAPPTVAPTPAVAMREGQVTIPTYPYADFSSPALNETFNVPYAVLDRVAYDASNPAPSPVTYRTLELENQYLKLVFLPDIGGRLYEVIYKPTGHRETYRNPVLKPSPWGPAEQGWWLAAGGIEWCLPVEEHGYEWGVPWKLSASQDLRTATVTLRDSDAGDRVRVVITVRLEDGASSFTIQHRLENPTGAPLEVKYWTNAMLAPGGGNAPSADLRFVLPEAVTGVTIHSRGDDPLPGYGQRMAWPVFNGVDYSRLGNWNRWLGFFEDPALGNFVAVYDEASDEGMVRVFPGDVAQGAKVFAFGWGDPIPAANWTDDRSGYVELHGGPAPTFDDSVTLAAGGQLQWTETWYPVAGLGGLRTANETAALNLSAGGGQAHLGVAVTRAWSGELVLLLNGQERWRQAVSLLPGQSLRQAVALGDDAPPSGRLALRLQTLDGAVAAEYSAELNLK